LGKSGFAIRFARSDHPRHRRHGNSHRVDRIRLQFLPFVVAQGGICESEFMPIFLSWSIEPGYRQPELEGFEMDAEERQLAELHGLDAEQICWRRNKIAQLGNESLFKQEYPIFAEQAFLSTSFDSFIPAELVIKARKEKVEAFGPLIVGVDPAGMGADRTSIAWRRGRCITKVESRRGLDTVEICGWIQRIIREDQPAKINIDTTGMGVGIYDRLMEMGHRRSLINAVNFAGRPLEPPPLDETGKAAAGGPQNRRSEMWMNLKKTLEAGRFQLPDKVQGSNIDTGSRPTKIREPSLVG